MKEWCCPAEHAALAQREYTGADCAAVQRAVYGGLVAPVMRAGRDYANAQSGHNMQLACICMCYHLPVHSLRAIAMSY